MSFATLEEAWGMPSLTQQADGGVAPAGFGSRGLTQGPAPQQQHQQHQQQRPAMRRRRKVKTGGGGTAAAQQHFAPVAQLMPQREDDDTEIQNSRRFLARTYARFGLPGLLRLMPREATAQMGGGGGGGRGRGARAGVWDSIVEFVTCPEKMLFMLLCAFAMLVVWDTWSSGSGGGVGGSMEYQSLASLQPFPVMMGTSGISG